MTIQPATAIPTLLDDLAARGTRLGADRIHDVAVAQCLAGWEYRRREGGHTITDEQMGYAEARVRSVVADARLAERLRAADDAGDLIVHEPGDPDMCTLGHWHTGSCE